MWKAEKIELVKNADAIKHYQTYFEDCFRLLINGELITNTIDDPNDTLFLSKCFQDCVCDYCGVEGCNAGGILMMRTQGNTLLILPAFSEMEEFKEYSGNNGEGDTECPPHKWFTDGILVIEGDELVKLYDLLPGIKTADISELSPKENDFLKEWELLVQTKPPGF